MKFQDILDSSIALKKLIKVSFPDFDKSFSVFEFSQEFNKAIDFFFNERAKIETLYCDEEGKVKPDCADDYELAANALLNREFDFTKSISVTFEDLKTAKFPDGDYFSAQDIMLLSKFIDNENTKE